MPSSAALDPRLHATLAFLGKLTLTPRELSPGDARAVLALGVSRAALRDAVYVAFLFNVYDRLANTLGWELLSPAALDKSARFLAARGYA